MMNTGTTNVYTDGNLIALHGALPIFPGDCQDDRPAAMEFGISSTPATADTSPTALRTISLGAMTSQPQSTLSPTGWFHYQSQHFTRNQHPKGLPQLTGLTHRSEENTSELQSLMRIPYAVFCSTKKQPRTHL